MSNKGFYKAQRKISAIFEFDEYGLLKTIYLNSQDEEDQALLIKGLSQILKPNQLPLIKF